MATYCAPADVLGLFPATDSGLPGDQVQQAIDDASAWIENQTQRVLASGTYTEYDVLRINQNLNIVGKVRQWPITAVSALSVTVDGTQTPSVLDVSWINFRIPPERLFYYKGPLTVPTNPSPFTYPSMSRWTPGVIEFTYTAGYQATDPEWAQLSLACALYAQWLLMADGNPLGAQTISVTAPGSGHSLTLPSDGSLHVKTALDMVRPFIRRD